MGTYNYRQPDKTTAPLPKADSFGLDVPQPRQYARSKCAATQGWPAEEKANGLETKVE